MLVICVHLLRAMLKEMRMRQWSAIFCVFGLAVVLSTGLSRMLRPRPPPLPYLDRYHLIREGSTRTFVETLLAADDRFLYQGAELKPLAGVAPHTCAWGQIEDGRKISIWITFDDYNTVIAKRVFVYAGNQLVYYDYASKANDGFRGAEMGGGTDGVS